MNPSSRKVVLVIASHPDDEVLGCGGTIAKHAALGDRVHVLIMSQGISSRADIADDDANEKLALRTLEKNTQQANEMLGTESFQVLSFPDNRFDSVDLLDVVKSVETIIFKYDPQIIYTHHAGDLNIDHQITHQAVLTASRPMPGNTIEAVLNFEVPSSTEWQFSTSNIPFCPNWFIDISDHLGTKLQALRCYEGEMREWPHARSYQSVEHLARSRGATIGVDSAEAFTLVRMVKK